MEHGYHDPVSNYLGWGIYAADDLYHHGIMNMKWGHRNGPPYPLRPGARSSAERKAGSPIADIFKQHRIKKKRKAVAKKARKTRQKNIKYEKARQKALKSGKASDVLKFRGNLTNQEMQDAIDRIQKEMKLEELSTKQMSRGQRQVDRILGRHGLGAISGYAKSTSELIKSVQEIDKALSSDSKKKQNKGGSK